MIDMYNVDENESFCGFAEAYCNRLHCKDCCLDDADNVSEEEVNEYINNFEVC